MSDLRYGYNYQSPSGEDPVSVARRQYDQIESASYAEYNKTKTDDAWKEHKTRITPAWDAFKTIRNANR